MFTVSDGRVHLSGYGSGEQGFVVVQGRCRTQAAAQTLAWRPSSWRSSRNCKQVRRRVASGGACLTKKSNQRPRQQRCSARGERCPTGWKVTRRLRCMLLRDRRCSGGGGEAFFFSGLWQLTPNSRRRRRRRGRNRKSQRRRRRSARRRGRRLNSQRLIKKSSSSSNSNNKRRRRQVACLLDSWLNAAIQLSAEPPAPSKRADEAEVKSLKIRGHTLQWVDMSKGKRSRVEG